MAVVCPTVTPVSEAQFHEQLDRILPFAKRIHLDFMDGDFAPGKSPDLLKAKWPQHVGVDLHLMFRNPKKYTRKILKLKPQMVIVHAEAEGDFIKFAKRMHKAKIMVGVALLAPTPVSVIESALEHIDHVLVFSGSLGHFGGKVDWSLTDKIKQLKQLKPTLEIGLDGGISRYNALQLVNAGVDVLNVGGAIQRAEDPTEAYRALKASIRPKKFVL